MRIDYQHVDITQEENVILKDVNFQAGAGEFIYLTGKVGTGKSSLLKTFYGELDVHTGTACVLDRKMNKIKRRHIPALRKRLGIIFQDFQLLTDRTAWDNLDFVLAATGWRDKDERDARIDEVLRRVGMQTKAFKMPHQLSGGEQQRIAIARALLNNPGLIIADEPTGNLDPDTGTQIMTHLHQISDTGTAVIVATHNLSFTRSFPGRVLRCERKHLMTL